MNQATALYPLPGVVPTATQVTATVVEQVQWARDTYRMRLHCPRIAAQIRPGQFFMIRPPHAGDPLLGRPFALFDVYTDESNQPAGIDFGYLAIGKMTSLMTSWKPGDEAVVWGPLGNGFPTPIGRHLMMIAGGIGQTPFYAVAREALKLRQYGDPPRELTRHPKQLTLAYGVRSAEYLAGVSEFQMNSLDVRIATEDGSEGHHGRVTDLLQQAIASENPPDEIFCCGPEAMMAAVQAICKQHQITAWLSLESPMACGCGICFSCVVKVQLEDGSWDYRRACVEGPVFSANQIVF